MLTSSPVFSRGLRVFWQSASDLTAILGFGAHPTAWERCYSHGTTGTGQNDCTGKNHLVTLFKMNTGQLIGAWGGQCTFATSCKTESIAAWDNTTTYNNPFLFMLKRGDASTDKPAVIPAKFTYMDTTQSIGDTWCVGVSHRDR